MSKKAMNRVVVVVRAGVVQDIYADDPDQLRITLLDLDELSAEGISEDDPEFHASLAAGDFDTPPSPLGTFEWAGHLPQDP